MMNKILLMLTLATFGCGHTLPDFTTRLSTRLPTKDSPEAIGEYSLGCLKGAQTFTGQEKGLVISQMKRGRYWGHPDLISLLSRAGDEFNKSNKKLIIGDLSQSRGGPTLTGHNSHQTGLDVDVWFRMPSASEKISMLELETADMNAFQELGEDQVKLIKYFAADPSVERIFINPAFKKKLCTEPGKINLTADEHRKLRAWWGHDDHIHVRLKCPAGSLTCVSQKPVPAGDGCGEELNWWFTKDAESGNADISYNELKGIYIDKVNKLPAACSAFLETF